MGKKIQIGAKGGEREKEKGHTNGEKKKESRGLNQDAPARKNGRKVKNHIQR